MAVYTNQAVRTLQDVMQFMAPFAGGTLPVEGEEEYGEWVSWIQNKQEEYAVRGFWRRLLTKETIAISGETTVLPERFHKANGLYILDVDGEDWADPDYPRVSVDMDGDPDSETFTRWQMSFDTEVPTTQATIWYFANPPKPTALADKLMLPGDMVGYSALAEYYRKTRAEGSQDKSEQDAENRFTEYISLEVIPEKSRLIKSSRPRTNRIQTLKNFYYRPRRYISAWR